MFRLLSLFENETLPLDLFMSQYFRANKAVGSKDRRLISDAVYGMIRWHGLFDHLLPAPTWEGRFSLFTSVNPSDYLEKQEIPAHIRVSFPKPLFELLVSSFGENQARDLCLVCNTMAPTTIRVNTAKISRDALFSRWKDQYAVSPCSSSPAGVIFHKKINFFSLPEFKEGLFEMQDEGSQLIADLVNSKPGEQILDFCAGAGGKSLAIAPRSQNRGQIYLHDIRSRALFEAKKRLRRAGVQNAQILLSSDPHKNSLKGKMDWVLVDTPCSGTGTLRRNPDQKWKFSQELLENLIQEQRKIFKEALEFLSPTGQIVYATCSMLPQENADQVSYFEKNFPVYCTKPPLSILPKSGGMDGFFGATFMLKSATCYSSSK
ncbi:MAG: RsmB/NOP family class I SAM-dependent RNA methyltransferase [Chlamydiales bacterium]